jgi:hypothetical protein
MPAWLRVYLLEGKHPERDAEGFSDWVVLHFVDRGAGARKLWAQHRKQLLSEWIQTAPGTRPWAFWEFDLPEDAERRKVRGSGEESAAYYGAGYRGYFDADPADPPRVESDAAFLRRLKLLLPGEEKRIPRRAFQPEALKVDEGVWAA